MKAALLRSWDDFASLEPEWNSLLARSGANSIFLTWDWIKAWSETAGSRFQPLIVTVRDQAGALAGIAPFYVASMHLVRIIPYRALRIMGDYPTGAEYGDWILDPAMEEAAANAIVEKLLEARDLWDCIWMPNVAGWTGGQARMVEAARRSGWFCHSRPVSFAYVSLPSTFDEYLSSLSAKKRHQVRVELKRCNNGVTLRECTAPEELPQYLDSLFTLHFQRWSSVGEEGSFRRKPLEAEFYRAFTPRALQKGWLRLFALEEKGAAKAAQIGYAYEGVFHSLQEGFAPDAAKGIGNALRAHIIDRCIREKLHGYDFLGEMSDHKRRWAAEERIGFDLLIGHPGWKTRLLFRKEIWPTGRYLRPVQHESMPPASEIPPSVQVEVT